MSEDKRFDPIDEILTYNYCSDEYLLLLAEDLANHTETMDLEDVYELAAELGRRYKKLLDERKDE